MFKHVKPKQKGNEATTKKSIDVSSSKLGHLFHSLLFRHFCNNFNAHCSAITNVYFKPKFVKSSTRNFTQRKKSIKAKSCQNFNSKCTKTNVLIAHTHTNTRTQRFPRRSTRTNTNKSWFWAVKSNVLIKKKKIAVPRQDVTKKKKTKRNLWK